MNKVYPKVSIIIPVYNGSNFLAEAIDSALSQTYQNFEIIVVNDGSNDDGATEHIALSYGDKIRYFSKPNMGVASALNRAIEEMSGEYFSWLSHDDLYCKDKVSQQMNALQKLGQGKFVIYSDYAVFTTNTNSTCSVKLDAIKPRQFRYWITTKNSLHGCTLLIPKSAFEECGVFNEHLRTTQDYDLWFRMALKYDFIHISQVLVKARNHSEQGSIAMSDLAITECNALLASFIISLSKDEIIQSTGNTLAISYRDIARNMWDRGFVQAGDIARKMAIKSGLPARDLQRSMIEKYKITAKNFLLKTARRVLSQKMRLMIKDIFIQTPKPVEIETNIVHFENSADLKSKFSEVYDKNIFGGRESRSGEGSDLVQTEIIRQELPRIVKKYDIRTFLDAPCGDWYWMQEVDLGVEQYIGVDIVDAIITKNNEVFGSTSKRFQVCNLAEDTLPAADLIFSRDCLVHLNFDQALKIIENFKKSGAKYLLTTTFIDRIENQDLVGDDFWRSLNMELAPFNFPKPLLLINENCTEENGLYADKNLGLWLLQDIVSFKK